MDIEKLAKEQAYDWAISNCFTTEELLKLENQLTGQLRKPGKEQLFKMFVDYDSMRNGEEVDNMEKAYEMGFKEGLKFINSILNLGEMEKTKLKEATIEKRAG